MKRLARFGGLVQTPGNYTIYYTGTQPVLQRFKLLGAPTTDNVKITIQWYDS
jgi:hypothetical protein